MGEGNTVHQNFINKILSLFLTAAKENRQNQEILAIHELRHPILES